MITLVTHPHFELILFGIGVLLLLLGLYLVYGAYLVVLSVSEGSNFDEDWDKDTK